MARKAGSGLDAAGTSASLQRRVKEPIKLYQLRIPLSWWEELSGLAKEFDQDVSIFLREATEDWLQKARKVQQRKDVE